MPAAIQPLLKFESIALFLRPAILQISESKEIGRLGVLSVFLAIHLIFVLRDVAQPGSALRSGRRGRWFESSHPD